MKKIKKKISLFLLVTTLFFAGATIISLSSVKVLAADDTAAYNAYIKCLTDCGDNPSSDCINTCAASYRTATGTSSGTGSVSAGSTSFTNPLQFNTVEGLLGAILSAVQKIIVVLALIFIVIGSVLILSSAGTPDMVERGKKAITMALVGLALGLAAPSILKELAGVLGWGGAATLSGPSLSQIALNVLSFLLGIAGVLTLIMLVIGAIMYLTSAGDEERVESGKKIFKSALIGIVIVMASMIIVRQIALFFQGSSVTSADVTAGCTKVDDPCEVNGTAGICYGGTNGIVCKATSSY
jgi:hypothetical protein